MAKQYIKNEQKNQTRSTNCNRKTANDTKIINLLKAKQLHDCQHHYNSYMAYRNSWTLDAGLWTLGSGR